MLKLIYNQSRKLLGIEVCCFSRHFLAQPGYPLYLGYLSGIQEKRCLEFAAIDAPSCLERVFYKFYILIHVSYAKDVLEDKEVQY